MFVLVSSWDSLLKNHLVIGITSWDVNNTIGLSNHLLDLPKEREKLERRYRILPINITICANKKICGKQKDLHALQ